MSNNIARGASTYSSSIALPRRTTKATPFSFAESDGEGSTDELATVGSKRTAHRRPGRASAPSPPRNVRPKIKHGEEEEAFTPSAESQSPPPSPGSRKRREQKKPVAKASLEPPSDSKVTVAKGDHLKKGLDILLCGVTLGRASAGAGYYYRSPSNDFWKVLAGSGFTDRILHYTEGRILPEVYNFGLTVLVTNPAGDKPTKVERQAGFPALLRKIIENRPRIVALAGKTISSSFLDYLGTFPLPHRARGNELVQSDGLQPGLLPIVLSLPRPRKGSGSSHRQKVLFWYASDTSGSNGAFRSRNIPIYANMKHDLEKVKSNSLRLPTGTIEYRPEDLGLPSPDDWDSQQDESSDESSSLSSSCSSNSSDSDDDDTESEEDEYNTAHSSEQEYDEVASNEGRLDRARSQDAVDGSVERKIDEVRSLFRGQESAEDLEEGVQEFIQREALRHDSVERIGEEDGVRSFQRNTREHEEKYGEAERETLIRDLDRAEQDLLKAFREASRGVLRGGNQTRARALLDGVAGLLGTYERSPA